jgi:hypothetical protein
VVRIEEPDISTLPAHKSSLDRADCNGSGARLEDGFEGTHRFLNSIYKWAILVVSSPIGFQPHHSGLSLLLGSEIQSAQT